MKIKKIKEIDNMLKYELNSKDMGKLIDQIRGHFPDLTPFEEDKIPSIEYHTRERAYLRFLEGYMQEFLMDAFVSGFNLSRHGFTEDPNGL